MATNKTIVWLRQDLRVHDNPALHDACKSGQVIPVYVFDKDDRRPGGASLWWVQRSLRALQKSLGTLIVRRGSPEEILRDLIKVTGADAVNWNRCYEPHCIARDQKLKAALKADGITVRSFQGNYLQEPWIPKTGSGGPYKVFTPFWRSLSAMPVNQPLGKPDLENIIPIEELEGQTGSMLAVDNPHWASDWDELWVPGESGGQKTLSTFLDEKLDGYGELRDRPDLEHVSRLSPHLHFGEISVRQIWKNVAFKLDEKRCLSDDGKKFLSELGWREFSNHLIYHFPDLVSENWKPAFDHYPWADNDDHLKAWQKGQTGYPLVDAGMRELWQTGYMHNRVRMVAASFLVKHLRIHWKTGETWFWDTLLDADLANNCSGWQWVAGSGADAAPYFRIFNPIAQAQRFDPNGEYIRKWCPELAKLPTARLHDPSSATDEELIQANIKLGQTYPRPIVDHKVARQKALDGYEAMKRVSEQ